ncbi:YrdB family protein [Floricoccus penangensis]|uniref:YrdB family protein n=1 Tax=Floricoccus penangensis TaxID=1859475 RepID=UPI0009F5CD89|nr:YrdB family protein [Floricoccus penangensis]
MKLLNDELAFLLELDSIIILSYWCFNLSSSKLISVALAIVIPLMFIVVWWIYLAPKLSYRLEGISLIILKLLLFSIVSYALISINKTSWAIVFMILVVINLVLSYIWKTL